ncbi:uncharacterized protein LOC130295695 [Hyla sarda]|uniref:uncharacterized protein LOC130295695 n=1 Tax=Hyla sarda TaxID=327740 RepID=UPI0024C2659D|nr:uncharacterized protein LOC130295695 [Hyla sarda]XP_056402692.1 uncharacterized protein LOC130295695 [Hyla sarda]XP_056402693.1 uncharacterized protein LOC130295695 [Hyla sarda]
MGSMHGNGNLSSPFYADVWIRFPVHRYSLQSYGWGIVKEYKLSPLLYISWGQETCNHCSWCRHSDVTHLDCKEIRLATHCDNAEATGPKRNNKSKVQASGDLLIKTLVRRWLHSLHTQIGLLFSRFTYLLLSYEHRDPDHFCPPTSSCLHYNAEREAGDEIIKKSVESENTRQEDDQRLTSDRLNPSDISSLMCPNGSVHSS